MRPSLQLTLLLSTTIMLRALSAPLQAEPIREATPPRVVAQIEAVGDQPPPVDILMQTFYNSSSIQIGDKLFLFTQAGTGDDFNDGLFCWGDQIVLWTADWNYEAIRSPFQLVGRVSPCPANCSSYDCQDPNRFAWGLGGILQSPHNGRYYMLLDYAVQGVDFNEGHFQEIRLFESVDGYSWSPADLEPGAPERFGLLRQSPLKCDGPYGPCSSDPCTTTPCSGLDCQIPCGQPGAEGCESDGDRCYLLQFLDVTLEAETDHWWGFFKYGTLAANRIGRIRIFPDTPSAGEYQVEILGQGGGSANWREVESDGSIRFMPRGFLPDFDLNDITETNAGHRVWGAVPVFDATEGCDEGIAGGSSLAYADFTEGSFDSVRQLPSTSRPSATINATGRLYPSLIIDSDGNRVLYSSSSDRLCEMPGSNWPPQGNFFVGLDIVATELTEATILDGFSSTSTRLDGSLLGGTTTEIGARSWTTINSVFLDNGTASDLGLAGTRAANVPFAPDAFADSDLLSLKAQVNLDGLDWVGMGFGGESNAVLSVMGRVWAKLDRLGLLRLTVNGNQSVAGVTLDSFTPDEKEIEIRFQRSTKRAEIFVDGISVLGPTTIEPSLQEIQSVGFQFFDTAPDRPGTTRLDRFELTLLGGPTIFTDGFESGSTTEWSDTEP